MPVIEGTEGLKEARGEYEFAVDGGAIGSIPLRGNAFLPAGSVIMGGYIEVDTLVTSAGGNTGTVALQAEAAADLQAAAAVSGAPFSTAGRKSIIPVFTGATTVKTTQARQLTAVVAVQALTAGKFRVVVFYR